MYTFSGHSRLTVGPTGPTGPSEGPTGCTGYGATGPTGIGCTGPTGPMSVGLRGPTGPSLLTQATSSFATIGKSLSLLSTNTWEVVPFDTFISHTSGVVNNSGVIVLVPGSYIVTLQFECTPATGVRTFGIQFGSSANSSNVSTYATCNNLANSPTFNLTCFQTLTSLSAVRVWTTGNTSVGLIPSKSSVGIHKLF